MVLKKEVANTSNGGSSSEGVSESGDMAGYRQSLVRTLHSCSIKFPAVAPSVVPLVSQHYRTNYPGFPLWVSQCQLN